VDLYPAIDLRAGRCVRLVQGDYGRETVYSDDPVAVARSFEAAGAPWIHVVDLDAARTGRPENREVVAEVAAAVSVPVQTGGGVRDRAAVDGLLEAGVARVVIGTAAVENPDMVAEAAAAHPGRVAVGLDHRRAGGGREVAVRGWTAGSGRQLLDVVAELAGAGVAAFVVTDIDRDGVLEGPDRDALAAVLAATTADVIASGGVSSAADLRALAAVEVGGHRLAGAIVGTAIYEGRISLREAVAACGR
jgi:phosphoribosylformimino-5-aminoimidazole carboxamide ribotide isomerase